MVAFFRESSVPRAPHGARQPAVGFRVVDELFFDRVPLQLSAEAQRDVFLLHHGLGAHRAFDGADGLLAAADGVQKIAAMIAAADDLDLVGTDLLGGQSDAGLVTMPSRLTKIQPSVPKMTVAPVEGSALNSGARLPGGHHIHVDQADATCVLVLDGVFVRHIADVGVPSGGAFHFDRAGVVGVGHPLRDIDVVDAPCAIQAAQAEIADEEPGGDRDAHVGVRRPGGGAEPQIVVEAGGGSLGVP